MCVNDDGEGFDFLGFHHRMVDSFSKPGFRFLARWPSARATRAARQRIRELTDRRLLLLPVEDVVANLNRFLIGWGGYFRCGNSTDQFDKIDRYAADRVARWLGERHQARRPLALRPLAICASSPILTACDRSSDASVLPARACGQVKDVGEPCEGEPHARFEAAAGGNRTLSRLRRASPGASRRPDHVGEFVWWWRRRPTAAGWGGGDAGGGRPRAALAL